MSLLEKAKHHIARLANAEGIGIVGLCGSIARGEPSAGGDVDVLVTVPLESAHSFAATLAEAMDHPVHLHAFAALPWHHPYHLCIHWLNGEKLPIAVAPRGAIIRRIVRHNGVAMEVAVPVESIPHFAPIDSPPPVTPQPGSRFVISPLGGFLL